MNASVSFIKSGTKRSKKADASNITIKKVIKTLIFLGMPILVKYVFTGLNSTARTILISIGDARSPKIQRVIKPKNNEVIKKISAM